MPQELNNKKPQNASMMFGKDLHCDNVIIHQDNRYGKLEVKEVAAERNNA
jgi:hypothetical protein